MGARNDWQVELVTSSSQYDILPLLGRGKHRTPRKGACFMELASYLAGQRWSDSPDCTHPLLAHTARLVNDLTDDASRPRLALLIPSVIGLQSSDPAWDHELALIAASHALPVAAEMNQRSLAVGILATERRYATEQGRPVTVLTPRSREALDQVPLAESWARAFISSARAERHPSPSSAVIECAVRSIAGACVADPAVRLHTLLSESITRCRELAGQQDEAVAELSQGSWRPVCRAVAV